MVNLSPTVDSFHESLCSLRLAKQVNQCELGKPKRQVKESNSSTEANQTPNKSGNKLLSSSLSNLPNALSSSKSSQMAFSASLGSKKPSSQTLQSSRKLPRK